MAKYLEYNLLFYVNTGVRAAAAGRICGLKPPLSCSGRCIL